MGVSEISDIREVARRARVSIGTVSNAFKRPEKVAPETRKRIFEAADELNYHPNQLASALVTSRTSMIGLMVSYAYNNLRGTAVKEFTQAASEMGYMVLLSATDLSLEKEKAILNRFLQYHVDGVVVCSDYIEGYSDHIWDVLGHKIPCVAIKRYHPNYENILISADRAMETIAVQMKRFHHYDVGIVTKEYQVKGVPGILEKRIESLKYYLDRENLRVKPEYLICIKEETLEVGKQIVDDLLASGKPLPTVFFCVNDYIAIGMMNRFQERGYRIPQDISIIGYGDNEVGACCRPALTTIEIGEEKMLLKALEMLTRRIQNPQLPLEDVKVEYQFIMRDSLGNHEE